MVGFDHGNMDAVSASETQSAGVPAQDNNNDLYCKRRILDEIHHHQFILQKLAITNPPEVSNAVAPGIFTGETSKISLGVMLCDTADFSLPQNGKELVHKREIQNKKPKMPSTV